MAGLIEQLDSQLEHLFAGWNLWSSFLTLSVIVMILYPAFFSIDPDTHPLLLSRQANAGHVRQPGESAIYRSLETPQGFPLKTGLNVKQPGASRWSAGKDGDLRDVWRRMTTGSLSDDGQLTGQKGKIVTVYGHEEIEEHDLEDLSRQMNIVGSYIKQKSGTRVALYLPNSIEALITIFASSFYGFSPVIIPYGQSQEMVFKLLQMTRADYLVAAAGSLPLSDLKHQIPAILEVLWVVEKTSKHMDWSEPSQGAFAWHEVIDDRMSSASSALSESSSEDPPPELVTVWLHDNSSTGEIVSFTQGNIVAAAGAQISTLPTRQRMTTNDVVLAADHFSNSYVLVQIIAALFSNASVALKSVAGSDIELPMATIGISPTIIIASPESILKLHETMKSTINNSLKKLAFRTQTQALDAGYMPPTTVLTRLNPPAVASLGQLPMKLRLIFICEKLHGGTPPLTSNELSEIRAFAAARIVYALTAAKVAGAVTQTSMYDYRRFDEVAGKHTHFGAPLSCLEIKLADTEILKNREGSFPQGEIVVSGPAVLNGTANLGKNGTFRNDGALAYM